MKNLAAVLEEAGSSLKNVVKVNIFLTDMANFAAMNRVYTSFFEEPMPVSLDCDGHVEGDVTDGVT